MLTFEVLLVFKTMKYYLKVIVTLFALTLSSIMWSQNISVVLDHFAIQERYFRENIGFSYIFSAEDALGPDEKNAWGFERVQSEISDYNYLFEEDEYWSIRVWRTIWLDYSPNECIKKGDYYINQEGQMVFSGGHSFLELVGPLLMPESENMRRLSLYKSPDYFYSTDTTLWRWLYNELWDDVRFIELKEDWHYNKKTGDFEKSIIGMGFYAPDGEGGKISLGWVYFPELVWELSHYGVRLNDEFVTWTNYFRQGHYLASVDSLQATAADHPSQIENTVDPDYCNDLDALWKLEQLKQVIKFGSATTDEESTRFHLNNHGRAIGKMVQGFPEGTWNMYNDNRKLLLTVDFASGVEHGVFRSYNDDGDLIEKGHFAFGLREGEWITYHPNGQVNTRRNYFKGWMKGKQLAFFDNGKPRLEYYYENHIIHGPFREWYRDGLVKQEGTMDECIRSGQWNFNIRLPQDYIDYVLKFGLGLDPHWNEDVLKDRTLSYTCNIEKLSDPSFYKGVLYRWNLIGEIK